MAQQLGQRSKQGQLLCHCTMDYLERVLTMSVMRSYSANKGNPVSDHARKSEQEVVR